MHYLVLQLESEMRIFQEGYLILRRVLHNKGALDLSWGDSYKIVGVLTPGAYQLAHLNDDQIPEIVEHRLFENVLSMIVCTFVNKVHNLKVKSSKTHAMSFELGGHIVWNA